MLNRSGESGQPCLIPDFQGNGFSFSPLNMMLAIGLSYIVFIMLRYITFITSDHRTFIWNCVEYYQRLFLYVLRWSSGFFLSFYYVLYYI
jgi:hypothetical protein